MNVFCEELKDASDYDSEEADDTTEDNFVSVGYGRRRGKLIDVYVSLYADFKNRTIVQVNEL